MFIYSVISILVFVLDVTRTYGRECLDGAVVNLYLVVEKADCFQSVSLPYPVSFGIQIIILLVFLSVIDDFAVDVGVIGTDTVIKIFAYFVVP